MSACFVTSSEMRQLERAAIEGGVSEEALMDEAAEGIARVVRQFCPQPGTAVIVAGKGHNAGDAFALAAHLLNDGWRVEARLGWPPDDCRPLTVSKLDAVVPGISFADSGSDMVPDGRPLLIVDAVLGVGAAGALRGRALDACRAINRLRQRHHAVTLAIDLPSGLDAGESPDPDTVVADITVTLGFPKRSLVSDAAAAFVGRIAVVPLPDICPPDDAGSRETLLTPDLLRRWIPPRPEFSRHKGDAGRIGILAGSRGLTGAARLAATAAVMAGGGLVTLFCPRDVYEILAASCPPEVMVRPVGSCLELSDFPLDVVAVGPGLGPTPVAWLSLLLVDEPMPVVVDADALNHLAAGPWLRDGVRFAGPRLLTPHPGELKRLVRAWRPEAENLPRSVQAEEFARAFSVTVLAKSARSAVVESGRPAVWNSTGHPLMAKGGMGDVLTGFCAALVAQGVPMFEAAAIGSWILGFGAERLRIRDGHEEPVAASQVMAAAAGDGLAALRDGLVC